MEKEIKEYIDIKWEDKTIKKFDGKTFTLIRDQMNLNKAKQLCQKLRKKGYLCRVDDCRHFFCVYIHKK